MPSQNPRNRMVVFRLTQEEYATLRDACQSKGGRNLSEFTRSELLAMMRSDAIAPMLHKRLEEIELKLLQLGGAVDRLTTMLGGTALVVVASKGAGTEAVNS